MKCGSGLIGPKNYSTMVTCVLLPSDTPLKSRFFKRQLTTWGKFRHAWVWGAISAFDFHREYEEILCPGREEPLGWVHECPGIGGRIECRGESRVPSWIRVGCASRIEFVCPCAYFLPVIDPGGRTSADEAEDPFFPERE